MTVDEAQVLFPGWDIRPIFGGFLAVPKSTPILIGLDVDSVAEKIRMQEKKS